MLMLSRVYEFAEKKDYLEIAFFANYSKQIHDSYGSDDFRIDGIKHTGLNMYPLDGFSVRFQLSVSTEIKKKMNINN